MAKLLALEWDAREARVAVARTVGSDVVIEQAFAIELGPREAGQTFADEDTGERIAKALADHGVGRLDTLVAVGRASIELRVLQVPQVPPEELPDLIRFQAMRQFVNLGEDWPLDFAPLDGVGDDDNQISVLAALPVGDCGLRVRPGIDVSESV